MAALNQVHTTDRDSAPRTGPDDDAYLGEGRKLLDRACTGDQGERGQTAVMADDLLDRARRSLADGAISAPCYARVLRGAALIRNMALLPELPPDPLVHDLVAHTVQHGLAAHNAAAQALRGTLAISRGEVDEALDAAVDAMATVELLDEHTVERALAMSDTASLLDQLGLSEVASDMYGLASGEFGGLGNVCYQIMQIGDQVRTQLLHGLWLERVGRQAVGAERFARAAELARAGMKLWRNCDPAPQLDDDFTGNYHAALAMAEPAGAREDHEAVLRELSSRITVPGQIMAGLALVRLLAATDRGTEAEQTLTDLRAVCKRFRLPMPLRMALARGVLAVPQDGSPMASYLTVLESEIWAMREARVRALHARLEHERLRRGREPMRTLTAKDPVTGLPDRSLLDEQLAALDRAEQPVVLAMVDIDDMVRINQRGSFADGDAALRAVAVTVRAAVHPEDTVLRYSADELVVIMFGQSLDSAAEIMRGVVTAVTALPQDRGHGATVSIGVVAVEPGEGGESALIRADDATARAKARGGNQIAVIPATPAPR